jgi:VanZ family protein
LFVVKAYHVLEFVLLFLLVMRAFSGVARGWSILFGVACCFVYAVSDEYHQTFVPGRGGTWTDVAIDMAGVLVVALLAAQVGRDRPLPHRDGTLPTPLNDKPHGQGR